MYIGKRDPRLSIAVPHSYCDLLTFGSEEYVEVFVPPANVKDYNNPWPSIVVLPKQCLYIPGTNYNQIDINPGSTLSLVYKEWDTTNTRRIPVRKEFDSVEHVLARFLQCEMYAKYHKAPNLSLDEIYQRYIDSGYTMLHFIKHC